MQSRHLMRSQSICTRCGQSLILLYGCLGVGGWSQFSVVFAWSSSVCSIFTSPVLAGDNAPLSMMSNRWSTMPTHFLTREQELPLPDDRAFLDRMPGSKVPVIHQQWQKGDMLPYWALTRFSGHHLYDLEADAAEEDNLAGSALEKDLAERLRAALLVIEAPESQFQRLGLTGSQ